MIRGGERGKRCGVDGRKMIGNYSMPSRVVLILLEMGRRGKKELRREERWQSNSMRSNIGIGI